jgi:hypothetical protein
MSGIATGSQIRFMAINPYGLPVEDTSSLTSSVTAQSAPADGRKLFGEMAVVTDEGAVVGRGNVAIGSVG